MDREYCSPPLSAFVKSTGDEKFNSKLLPSVPTVELDKVVAAEE